MNEKQRYIYEILDICVAQCSMDIDESTKISRDDVLSKCKKENVCMTRCIFTTMLKFMGFSNTTIAATLQRSEQAIGDLLNAAHGYKKVSWAYRIAEAKCRREG